MKPELQQCKELQQVPPPSRRTELMWSVIRTGLGLIMLVPPIPAASWDEGLSLITWIAKALAAAGLVGIDLFREHRR
ncbi:hypothetical protein [Paractinoplanes rishiriensis]|uniref:Uncharacterized protein n=1 Tax=Paractinoplanes rishiriensis TaxID=1050105 RepID=A0A919JS71_9ACTN|nr:hypothetical protein [Actinoplanes rishiriensis]GIE93870.1 hypothetical protein Ari01nite_13350 [Actinoplanes rishiriensis]